MHNKTKHSKIRNSGLLFEFLLRQITLDVLNKQSTSKAVKMIKENFNDTTELGKELGLYNVLLNTKFSNDKKAEFFINEVLQQRQKINNSKLRRERYNLVRVIKENYDMTKLFSSKVKNYKLYATIYKLFELNQLSPEEKTESFFNIVEHITTPEKTIKLSETIGGGVIPNDSDLRILTYRTLLEKFNAKYSKLNKNQKNLLREYINNISNTSSLKDTIQVLVKELKKDLKTHKKNLKDEVVQIKMKEAINSINEMCGLNDKSNVVKDKHVLQTMRYLELLKELKKSGQKTIQE
tara:strand:+ start:206 stop:1087 length:882 start_codon:yes stop_codon:yes gene_type:complete